VLNPIHGTWRQDSTGEWGGAEKEKLFSQHCAILRVRPRLEAAPERRRLLPGAAVRAVVWPRWERGPAADGLLVSTAWSSTLYTEHVTYDTCIVRCYLYVC